MLSMPVVKVSKTLIWVMKVMLSLVHCAFVMAKDHAKLFVNWSHMHVKVQQLITACWMQRKCESLLCKG